MTVRITMKQGGAQPQMTFSDNFNRADGEPGRNWIRLLGGNDNVSPHSWGTMAIVSNQAKFSGLGGNNPASTLFTTFLPVPLMHFKQFNTPRQFVQATFVSAVGISCFLGCRFNF